MNAQLHTPDQQHDYLWHELHVLDAVTPHSIAVVRDAFQRLLDDENGFRGLLRRMADAQDHAALGLHIRVALNDAADRYVHTHIAELEAEPDRGDDAL